MLDCIDLGICEYKQAYEIQKQIHQEVYEGKRNDTLIFVEHPPVLTLGASFHSENLLFPEDFYAQRGIAIEKTDRGGDVTYHCPGQLVLYPIFNIAHHGRDLHKWLRDLEEVVILTLAEFNISSRRFPPHTGVWVEDKKIAAIGVKAKKWVNLHGIAINCTNDLTPFQWFVPCGIKNYGVTSLERESGQAIDIKCLANKLHSSIKMVFEF